MIEETFLKNCINYRCALKIEQLREQVSRKMSNARSKGDCLSILTNQRIIYALKELISANWDETIANICLFVFFEHNFEYKKIVKYKSKGIKSLLITKYLQRPDEKMIEQLFLMIKNDKPSLSLQSIEERLSKL
ncbi:hypothetical protein COBT_000023 [Conglomerata obtusa]